MKKVKYNLTMSIIYISMIILIGIAIAETILLGSWNKKYFSFGLPLFSKTIDFQKMDRLEKIGKFIENIDSKKGLKNMTGKVIDEDTFFFREKMFRISFFSINYTPVMHGLIKIDRENRLVMVKGLSNNYIFLFCIFFICMVSNFFMDEPDLSMSFIFLIGLVFVFGLCYFIQYFKYKNVTNSIKQLVDPDEPQVMETSCDFD